MADRRRLRPRRSVSPTKNCWRFRIRRQHRRQRRDRHPRRRPRRLLPKPKPDFLPGSKTRCLLRRLNLRDTMVTDEGLKSLHGLDNLKRLNLRDTKVTSEGKRALQKALPGVVIAD